MTFDPDVGRRSENPRRTWHGVRPHGTGSHGTGSHGTGSHGTGSDRTWHGVTWHGVRPGFRLFSMARGQTGFPVISEKKLENRFDPRFPAISFERRGGDRFVILRMEGATTGMPSTNKPKAKGSRGCNARPDYPAPSRKYILNHYI